MTPHPPADRFRVGDVWRSPRGKDWTCDKEGYSAVRLRSVHNPKNTQWRGIYDTGRDMLSAWQRITPPQEN
jgi:hypothetical protein